MDAVFQSQWDVRTQSRDLFQMTTRRALSPQLSYNSLFMLQIKVLTLRNTSKFMKATLCLWLLWSCHKGFITKSFKYWALLGTREPKMTPPGRPELVITIICICYAPCWLMLIWDVMCVIKSLPEHISEVNPVNAAHRAAHSNQAAASLYFNQVLSC